MSQTRKVCVKNSRIAQEWADNGALLYGHRNVADNMSWQAGIPTLQDKQDEAALARGVCPYCFCVVPVAGVCC